MNQSKNIICALQNTAAEIVLCINSLFSFIHKVLAQTVFKKEHCPDKYLLPAGPSGKFRREFGPYDPYSMPVRIRKRIVKISR